MNEPEPVSEPLQKLIDDYLDGLLDETHLSELEERLRADGEARRYFVRYARLHTDLHLEVHARRASERALGRINQLTEASPPLRWAFLRRPWGWKVFVPAACLLLALGAGWWLRKGHLGPDEVAREPAIAWLVNAQNCQWSEGEPTGDMQAGKVLKLERGLAEIRFQCGARVVLESPAGLDLLSGKSARLRYGKLTARVPGPATGFTILSPQGKVIDLGTEFGISVSDNGATEVYVFEGNVEAHAADNAKAPVSLTRNQAAQIAAGKVTLQPAGRGGGADRFVRAIVPSPVIRPRTLRLTFDQPAEGGIRDANGLGTGLTFRLPGTGRGLAERDPNLRLDRGKAQLELTTTNSDLNTQYKLHHGEYLGVRLADLGFTGPEDFAVTVTIPDIPALEVVGQFGLYAGVKSNRNIRGGLLSARRQEPGHYTQFLVNNKEGTDDDIYEVGLLSTGTDLRMTLKRIQGKYSLMVENLTTGSTSTLTIRHPDFLDNERDLFVGLFGANTQSDVRKTLVLKEFEVTVWTAAPSGPLEAGPTRGPRS
jgi:ferric-dicitrate binding protein FerR (iron transport regulator)